MEPLKRLGGENGEGKICTWEDGISQSQIQSHPWGTRRYYVGVKAQQSCCLFAPLTHPSNSRARTHGPQRGTLQVSPSSLMFWSLFWSTDLPSGLVVRVTAVKTYSWPSSSQPVCVNLFSPKPARRIIQIQIQIQIQRGLFKSLFI